ncbi:ornithine carbamoyltransferase [Algisphaera agarilytica]|uniref:Ornithine carbamoyltransferase n=1 Tax=Algisphaera agarilytica TaxID=1385975 RepID=A0A7X0HB94_9BACT|nr:ornithine carbamoyltransferase [Algisphaera agarilytica]MBB6431229.1 ornithine carbamoyltransferase [Algisphaera agarilytica]
MRHFLTIADQHPDTIKHMLEVGIRLRDERQRGVANEPVLAGKTLAMLFQKPSLRTRVSFEQAMYELGGNAIVLGQNEVGLGTRESVGDVTRVLCGMVHGIAARVFKHEHLVEMSNSATAPIVNMLSDFSHPAQALADAMTIIDEFSPSPEVGGVDVSGKTVAFVGDGNNVARSLAAICKVLGMNFVLASPEGYELPDDGFIQLTRDPEEAVEGADVIYADTFVSMGEEGEKDEKLKAFEGFQINRPLVNKASEHAIVLHCLPAYRGIEITDQVMDGPRSRVFSQAHNRLHAQKGLLAVLLGGV